MKNPILLTLLILEVLLALTYYCQPKQSTANTKRRYKIYLFMAFLMLITVHIMKDPESLPDLPFYIDGFKEVSANNMSYIFAHGVDSLKSENGWHVLCKLISYISSSPFFFILCTSFIILIGYYLAIRDFSSIYWLSTLLVLLGPFCQSLYVLRQYMAMSILLMTYHFIIEKRIWAFLLFVLLAFNIHQTAIIFLPIYFLYHLKGKYIYITIVAIIAVCVYIIYYVDLRELAINAVEETNLKGYDSYLKSETETNWKAGAYTLVVALFRLMIMKRVAFEEGINRLLTFTLFVAVLIGIIGIGLVFTGRLNLYFSGIIFLVIPNTAKYIRIRPYRYAFISVMLGFSIFMWLFGNGVSESVNSYRFL